MRIVHLTLSTTSEVTGGLEYHIAYLAEALRERGHEIIVVNMATVPGISRAAAHSIAPEANPPRATPRRGASRDAYLRYRLDALGETVAMCAHRVAQSRHAPKIARHVCSLQPDIVHQHAYLDGLGACWLLARQYPIVFTNHTGAYLHLDRHGPTRFLQRQLMKQFTMVIGPSRELLPHTENSHYVPNGVDTGKFQPVSAAERGRLKAKHGCADKHVFLCPRRWAPTKGIIYLAEALRRVKGETRERSVFLFAGNETPGYDRYQENVRQALAAAHCDARTLGNLNHAELAELMSLSDACIIPSLMEATSLACLEAMACGTPVLGTETGGLLELIRDGENGWLVPMRDARSLAARLDAIVGLGDLQTFRDAAVETVRERYTWKVAAESTEVIYRAALEKWRRRRAPARTAHAEVAGSRRP